MVGIYCIENTVNHKKYIGQSIDIRQRWHEHKHELNNGIHSNSYLQNSWNKYGKQNFRFSTIIECDKYDLNDFEEYFIGYFSTLNRKYGFNLRNAGSNGSLSQETKDKLKELMTGRYDGRLNPFYGKKHNEDARKKMSKAKRGKYTGKDNHIFGKSMSKESKQKMSIAKQGMYLGESNPAAKITEDEAKEIIKLILLGKRHIEISRLMNVSCDIISKIRRKKTWRHLTKSVDFNIA